MDWIKIKLKENLNIQKDDAEGEEEDAAKTDEIIKDVDLLTELTQNDFDVATKSVQPSSKREGFATVPDVTWDDVGALQSVREELATAILVSGFILISRFNDHIYFSIPYRHQSNIQSNVNYLILLDHQEFCYVVHQVVVKHC